MAAVKSSKRKKSEVKEILNDYWLTVVSREASIIGRKEVFMGKAKFGIFGDGKELPQIAMAKAFERGDFRSGYYRDQTFMMAIGELTIKQYFAQLYAHTDIDLEPASAGRLMNGHFATRLLDKGGARKALAHEYNSSADISPTAGQMPRLVGLGYASKLFRENKDLHQYTDYSSKGNEVAFGTIGNASTSEGMFYESMNAIAVLQIPVVMAVWDDGYGISVPNKYHTVKESISKALAGFQRNEDGEGFEIITVAGWDYPGLCAAFKNAAELARRKHIPVLVHVLELTQPQGHSTSGSHERYKSAERLEWEQEQDCNKKFREWIIDEKIAEEEELASIEKEARSFTKGEKKLAWEAFTESIKAEQTVAIGLLSDLIEHSKYNDKIVALRDGLTSAINPIRSDTYKAVKRALRFTNKKDSSARDALKSWLASTDVNIIESYSSDLYSRSEEAAIKVKQVNVEYSETPEFVDGREVLRACFDLALEREPRLFAIGEDVGRIGDVNQAFAGLQEKYGELRVTDTGIRETTIIGQGIGAALRGLRPITEIQYLDYLVYALPTLTDDLSCLRYRTKSGQSAPLIIRTRGHRLEGVWHSGSPMGMILNSLRGIYVLVPRDMTKAAGFYNTMLKSDDTAIIVECLNGYRLKEKMPQNLGDITTPLGIPEVIREGSDVTVVTYGSMCRIMMEAAKDLSSFGIECEVIDVQTLLPFDVDHTIVESLKKTSRVVFADEDVPGGATAFMMQKVVEEQNGFRYLDSNPVTISAKEHRPAYASDGDYFSKPNLEEVFDKIYAIMHEFDPAQFREIY